MAEFKWIWQFLKKRRFTFLAVFILIISVILLNMINPFVQGMIVDRVIKGGEAELLLTLVMIMIGSTVLKSIVRYFHQCMTEKISQDTVFDIREDIYGKVQALDFEFFDKTKTGDIMSRLTGDLEAVRHFTSFVIFSMFTNVMTFITVIIILFSINATFTLALLAVAPVIGVLTYKLATSVKPAFSEVREQFSKLNSVVQENISGNRVIKAFTREEHEIYKFSRENEGFKEKNLNASRIWEKYLPVLDTMAGVLSVVIIVLGSILVINGRITLGQLVTFNGFVWALNGPMRMAGWLINDAQRFAASAEKIMLLLGREPKVANDEKPLEKVRLAGLVEFRDVSFAYGEEKVLNGVSFKAKPGQTVAVIGPTGSGKSSLVNLITRFYDCTDGEVLIDGVNIKKYDLRKLRENVAVAMQDIFLFSDTIEGNIAYGVPDISMDRVEWAAGMADAHGFITDFNGGYDTIIGERGVGLSGGQKQRIALARAIIKEPAILILDDTTSSVDIETEHEIHKTLKGYYGDKTTFVIAHRISSVKNADLILVLDNGRIAERGTHEELLSQRGYYHSVFINQYGDFDDASPELAG